MWSYEELYRDVCVEFDLDCLWLNIIIAWYYSKVKNIINGERERESLFYMNINVCYFFPSLIEFYERNVWIMGVNEVVMCPLQTLLTFNL